mmetsp:Transcript_60950/g.142576  ORF Transcript_60950/g.142576 Transcript_60950/m.142576 type:complete len:216 (+) Transcript_60950:622-1269(+)
MSIPFVDRYSRRASSSRPIGARTNVEMWEPLTWSLTFFASASVSVSHWKYLVLPCVSVAFHCCIVGKPTFSWKALSTEVTLHSTSSLRYTVVTPGKEGESVSSSCRSTVVKSKVTLAGSMFIISFRMRSAVCLAFSCGSFLVPGSRSVSRSRPSGNCSLNSTRSREPSVGRSFKTTMSTTRTSFLCCCASNISLEAPVSTSLASCSMPFAFPTPN